MNILIDTNIALYFLSGDKKLADLLDNTFTYLLFVTELELLAYPNLDKQEKEKIKAFIGDCIIIAATTISEQLPFLSADNDFKRVNDLQLFSYQL